MTDREKVIKQIEKCINNTSCIGCPYEKSLVCRHYMLADALALIKEQEDDVKQVYLYGKDEWWGLVCVCPDCKAEWMSDKADTNFCPKCGRQVKWE
jgi:hypothetical protein